MTVLDFGYHAGPIPPDMGPTSKPPPSPSSKSPSSRQEKPAFPARILDPKPRNINPHVNPEGDPRHFSGSLHFGF